MTKSTCAVMLMLVPVLLAGCGDKSPKEQVRAACEHDLKAKLKHDHVEGAARFVSETVTIGSVRTRGEMQGVVKAGRVRHDFLCAVERKDGRWGLVSVLWRS